MKAFGAAEEAPWYAAQAMAALYPAKSAADCEFVAWADGRYRLSAELERDGPIPHIRKFVFAPTP